MKDGSNTWERFRASYRPSAPQAAEWVVYRCPVCGWVQYFGKTQTRHIECGDCLLDRDQVVWCLEDGRLGQQ